METGAVGMRKRELALLVFIYLALAEVLSWHSVPDTSLCLIQPGHSEQSTDHNGYIYCPAFHTGIIAFLGALDGFLGRHDKSVVGGFTIVLAISTIGLWLATIGLYQAGERQLAHFKGESEAADFHRTSQFEQIAEQISALRQSAEAAESQVLETRELVWTGHLNAQRQLRAYVVADARDVEIVGPENEVRVTVRICIKNTGQTPAHDLRVVSKTELIEHPIKMPFDFTLVSGPDPSAAVLGAGELTESESRPERPFGGDEMMMARAEEAGARIYTWGTITYRDVFGNAHYTNFCSSLIFVDGKVIAHASEHHNDAS